MALALNRIEQDEKSEHTQRERYPQRTLDSWRIHPFQPQFYLMLEGQLILLTESTDLLPPGYWSKQFYLVPEGQLILLTESTKNTAPGCEPRQFILMQEGTTERADSASRSS